MKFLKSLLLSLGRAFAANEYIKNYTNRHQPTFSFLKKRCDLRNFSGLPLTLGAGAFLYILALFLGVIEDISSAEPIVAADQRFNKLVILLRSPAGIKVFLWITAWGRAPIIISVVIAFLLLFWLWRKREYIIPFLVSVVGGAAFSTLGKLAFQRPRPISPVYLEQTYSLPSGHATVAVAIYGFLFYFFWKLSKKKSARILLLISWLMLALLIGFSRLYLGVHYLSDVWGGYLLGLLWLIIGISLVEWQNFDKKKIIFKKESPGNIHLSKSRVKALSAILIIITLAFGIISAGHYRPPLILPLPARPKIVVAASSLLDNFSPPRYTETIDASAQEPLSFVIAGRDDAAFIAAMAKSGWSLADPIDLPSLKKSVTAALLNQAYPSAPMTPSFWNGEVHDFGFEKQTALASVRQRHHARFWKTNLTDNSGRSIYVGTASYDIGLKWGITHQIAPDVDTERELLFKDLNGTGAVTSFNREPFVAPHLGKNFTGDLFFTDGEIYIIDLN
jgi:undecaprenyl-diphosphatase